MNSKTAKEILALYRPGTADEQDDSFREARKFCETDPELREWFENHCAAYSALRSKFKQVPVPSGLREQIIAERKVQALSSWRRKPALVLALLAVIAVALGLVWSQFMPQREAPEDLTYNGFRQRMVDTAFRAYGMVPARDPAQVRAILESQKAPTNYDVPKGLEKTTLTGCAVAVWHTDFVSIICYRSGSHQDDLNNDLWLFVADRRTVPDFPPSTEPRLNHVNGVTTAMWVNGDKTYLLVAKGDQEFIRRFL